MVERETSAKEGKVYNETQKRRRLECLKVAKPCSP